MKSRIRLPYAISRPFREKEVYASATWEGFKGNQEIQKQIRKVRGNESCEQKGCTTYRQPSQILFSRTPFKPHQLSPEQRFHSGNHRLPIMSMNGSGHHLLFRRNGTFACAVDRGNHPTAIATHEKICSNARVLVFLFDQSERVADEMIAFRPYAVRKTHRNL